MKKKEAECKCCFFFSKIGLVTAHGGESYWSRFYSFTSGFLKDIVLSKQSWLTNQIAVISIEMSFKTERKITVDKESKMVVYVCSVAKKWLLMVSMAARMII